MNVALWLERAGKSHAASRAVALGERVVLDYGTLATRVAAALRATRVPNFALSARTN